MTSRRADALAALLLALAVACLLTGLGRVPALTVDEAWVGTFAAEIRSRGLFSPHEMNTYTGPLFAWLAAKVLALRGTGVAPLRLFGAAANACALLFLAAGHRRRLGAGAASWLAVLFAGSAYFLLKSRLAWEVYALQPLLLSLTIETLEAPVTLPRAWLFCLLTLIGVQNHFIYLAVPLSLCVLFGARAAWREDDASGPWLRVALSSLAAGAVVFAVKPRLTQSAWPAERNWALPLFFLLPVAAAVASAQTGAWERPLLHLLRRDKVRRCSRLALKTGLAAFAVWHLTPVLQLMAGPLVWRRVFSWAAPAVLIAPLGLWSAFLLGLLAWRAVRAWHAEEPMTSFERTLALWPIAYAAIFILFRNTTSLRYYSALQFLCLAALAQALDRLPRPDKRLAAVLAAVALAATQTVFWRELASPGDRRPLTFKIGTHVENSRDFTRKDALFAAFDASGACGVAAPERNFVSWPLGFHRLETGPVACDRGLAFDADLEPDRAAPPFYRWSVVTAPR